MLKKILLKGMIEKCKLRGKRMVSTCDIFADIWSILSDGDKRKLGKYFFEETLAGSIDGVKFLRKNSSGHAYYELI